MFFNKKLYSILLAVFFAFSAQVRADFMGSVTNSQGVVTNIEFNSYSGQFGFFFVTKYIYTQYTQSNSMVATDLLAPAGMGSNVLTVGAGYCALVSNAQLFRSDKTIFLGEGRYDVASQFGLTGGIHSLLLYPKNKMRTCQKQDIPLVYDKNGKWFYPLVGNLDTSAKPYTNGFVGNAAVTLDFAMSTHARQLGKSIYSDSSGTTFNGNLGGWIGQTKTLTVPICYKVTLYRNSSSKTYSAGTYDIGNDIFDSNSVALDQDCLVYSSGSNNQIRYTGGTNKLCLVTENNSTANGARIVLGSCSGQSFKLLEDGTLHHIPSGKCAHPLGGSPTPGNGTSLILHSGCGEDRLKFSFTTGNGLKQITSGMCVHPSGGSASSPAGTPLVFWAACNERHLSFAPYSESVCTTTITNINIGISCSSASCGEAFGRTCTSAGGTTIWQGGSYACQKPTTTCTSTL